MLPKICRLLNRQRGIALDDYTIETFLEQRLHRFGQVPHNLCLQILDLVENRERPVLEDRVGIYGQNSSFHNSQIGLKTYSRNLAREFSYQVPFNAATLPGEAARQNAPEQRRAPSENGPSRPPEGPLPPCFEPAFRRRF